MNFLKHIVFLFSTVCMAAGPVQAAGDSESEQPNRSMEKQWNETLETLKSSTAEQRDKALKAGRKTLDAMDERIEKMEAWTKKNWESLSEGAREKRSAMLSSMRKQRNEVAEWYGGMKHSSSEAWDNAKQGFIKSYDKLQKAYGSAVDSFQSDENEPTSE